MHFAHSCPGLCGGGAFVSSSTYLSAFAVALVAAFKCGNAAHTRRGSEPNRTIAAAAPPASLRKRRRGGAVSSIISILLVDGRNTGTACMVRPPRADRIVFRRGARVTFSRLADRRTNMPLAPPQLAERLRACGAEIAQAGAELAARGWTPATSSNFSMCIDGDIAAITISGRDKGALTLADVMAVTLDGQPLDPAQRPSAETALHLQIYRRQPNAGAVLHTHSHNQTVASRLFAPQGMLALRGWELHVPVFPNSQDMRDIEAAVDAWIAAGRPLHAYLIEGHGLYTWGRSMPEAKRHLEALEFLLACELDLIRLGGIP